MEFEGEQLNLWLLTERASLREKLFNRAAAALEETTRFGADRGGNIGKIADRLLAFEPDSPECYRIISKAYGRCGDQDGVDRIDRLMNSVLNPALPRLPGNTSGKPSGTVWVAPTGVKPVEERPATPKPPVPRVAFSSPPPHRSTSECAACRGIRRGRREQFLQVQDICRGLAIQYDA